MDKILITARSCSTHPPIRHQCLIWCYGLIVLWPQPAAILTSAEIEWSGDKSHRFDEPANWVGNDVPGLDDTATIVRTEFPARRLAIARDDSIIVGGLQIGRTGSEQGLHSLEMSGADLDVGEFTMQWSNGVLAEYYQRGGQLWVDELVFDGGSRGLATFQIQAGDVWIGEGGIRMMASHPDTRAEILLLSGSTLDARDAGSNLFSEIAGQLRFQLEFGSMMEVAGNVTDMRQLSEDVQFSARMAPCDVKVRDFVFEYDPESDITFITTGTTDQLFPGDADMDSDFDQLDLVRVQIAGKYLTGESATWGEGDWNGGPGGGPGNPPPGDGLFNQMDIIAALEYGIYASCGFAAVTRNESLPRQSVSIDYGPETGEATLDTAGVTSLSSIHLQSASGVFTGDAARNLVPVPEPTSFCLAALGVGVLLIINRHGFPWSSGTRCSP